MRTIRRWLCRGCILLLALSVAGAGFLALAPQGRAVVKTALFISQVVPAVPSQTWFQPAPVRERIQVPTPEGPREADLYRPPGAGPYAATVFFLGVAPAGPDDARVVGLGNALARAGMVTLMYWSPEMLERRIHPPDIQNLVAAFQFLQAQPMVDEVRVGMGGLCVGASFVLMAAAQEEVRDDVVFVNAFGPYFRLDDLARAIGTRTRFSGDERTEWAPGNLTRDVTIKLLLGSLVSEPEAAQVEQALAQGEGLSPAGLSPEAYAVYRVLTGGTVAEVESAIAALPADLLAKMAEVSPARYVDAIRAPVLVMHDRDDDAVPPEESRRLAAALGDQRVERYTEFSLFQHVTPTRPVGIIELGRELNKLFWHMYGIMRQTT